MQRERVDEQAFRSQSAFLYNNIISMYTRCGSLRDSHLVFDKMPHRTLVSYNTLLSAYSRVSDYAISALKLYTQMETKGLRPSSMTFTSLLQASSLHEDWLIGSLLHAKGLKFGFLNDICVQTSLLNMYSNCRDLSSAELVFWDMTDRDDVAWNSLMVGYLKNNKIEEGVRLFIAMVRLKEFGFPKPDDYTYAGVISATGAFPSSSYGKPLHAQVTKAGFERSVFVGSTLVSMYFKNHESEAAQRVFYSISGKDVVLWTEMITGYSKMTDGMSAIRCFFEMHHEAHEVDDYVLSGVLSACADLAILRQG
ncbi:Tetratricopeptide-like helical domain superfamily [Sesbania bispinosa]|nr:Tetratricopeptide-like helical domain superfamily [Sesbania bispinosa]